MSDQVKKFQEECVTATELFAEKNRLYGNAIVETGVLGAVVELVGITARLKQMVIRSSDAGASQADKLEDILMDAHNYVNIARMMLREGNYRGRYDNG